MNLSELREAFKSASGFLYWENSEIDKALNNGMKFLDSKTEVGKKLQRYFSKLRQGEYVIAFPTCCKVIKEVWLNHVVEGRSRIKKGVRNLNIDSVIGEGKPSYYCPFSVETYEKTLDAMEFIEKYGDVTFTMGEVRGIAFDVNADKDYYLEIYGKFESNVLTETFPENWWSKNYPELVVDAAIYRLDVSRRNASGGMELFNTLMDSIKELNNDSFEEELEDTDLTMEG